MTESLSTLGADGAEILRNILNRYFTEMISIVHFYGGEVMKFGGDSILCFFPGENTLRQTLSAASTMMASMHRFQNIKTPVQKFSLRMKMGIAAGEILIAGLGKPEARCEHVFAGEPVDLAGEAERHAKAGDIILSVNGPQESFEKIDLELVEKGFFRICNASRIEHYRGSTDRIPAEDSSSSSDSLKPFLIQEVYEMVSGGYDRFLGALQTAVPVFLQFTGFFFRKELFSLDTFHEFFTSVVEAAHRHNGRLDGVVMGDKGATFYLLFGAPKQIEKKEKEACEWALEVREFMNAKFPESRIKIGIASGRVFSGIVGGSGRFDYTLVGDTVNLSARLMQTAGENQICVSREIQEKSKDAFSFSFLGETRVKGKSQIVPIYSLEQRIFSFQNVAHRGDFVGRISEIEQILNHLKTTKEGNPRFVIVEGEAGVGKSFLSDYVCSLARNDNWQVIFTRSEITRRTHPYFPWLNIFRTLLFDGRIPDLDEIRTVLEEFEKGWGQFLPWHAAFFQVRCDEGLSSYDENTKKVLLQHQLSCILLKKTQERPTLIFLDDLHWFDSLSLEMLSALLNHFEAQPVLLLGATRPEWRKEEFAKRPNCFSITLAEMDSSRIKELAEKFLGGSVKESLVDFLFAQTKGNPFFTYQLLDYLQKKGFLVHFLGTWTIQREKTSGINFSGEEIIIAQTKRLSALEMIHLRSAACMGPTFSLLVLKDSLGSTYRMSVVESLCSLGYFLRTENDWATFPHALVQEALYFSIPQRIRKSLHRKIAKSMEALFSGQEKYYPNLANHFLLAQVRRKAIDYSLNSANQLFSSLSFFEAAHYFEKAYELLKFSSDPRKWEAGLKLAEVLVHTGNLKDSLKLSMQIRARSRRLRLRETCDQACVLQFDVMRRVSDYTYLGSALKLLKRKPAPEPHTFFRLSHLIGSTYFWLGRADQAGNYLRRVISYEGDIDTQLSAYVFLFNIAADRQNFEEAFTMIQNAMDLAHSKGAMYQGIRIQYEWGSVLVDNGKPEEAVKILLELLPAVENLGDFYLLALILSALGQAGISLHQWDQAKEYLEEAMRRFVDHGIPHGKAKVTMRLGILSFYRDEYEKSYEYYLEANAIFENAREKREACFGYYNLSEVCLKLEKAEEAMEWYRKGIDALPACNSPRLAAMFNELGRLIRTS